MSRDIMNLKDELSHLQIQHKELKQDCVDLYAKVDSACEMLEALNISMKDWQGRISVLNQSTDNNIEISTLPFVYLSAYSDYSVGKFDIAYYGFKTFIDKYPNSEYVPQAQFYMGECFYSKNMLEKALEEYKKVEQYCKTSCLVPSSRLKIALCYELLGKYDKALNVFSSILKDFPKSPESVMSSEKLETYNNVQKN
ncbi:MAG: tetratricopeptide repeat protein [Endomicrobium sp.]|nr:tetratricopeptide repeat protein [Endomicrobium sp.]